jgi:hypothetical protein
MTAYAGHLRNVAAAIAFFRLSLRIIMSIAMMGVQVC